MKKRITYSKRIPAMSGGRPMFKKPVPITVPTIPDIKRLKSEYEKILKSGMITNSKTVQAFEKLVVEYLGVKHAVAVSSCTSGLMLIMKALGLKGEVIVPSFTFHATAHAAVWNGLKPVFVDCDPDTYNIDPQKAEKAVTRDTCAILGVHIFGNPADVIKLEKIARKNKIRLIFDAAHGFGSRCSGRNVGGFGDAESFSLSPTKLLTAGEGGIVATNNKEIAEKVRIGRNYGDSGNYDCEFSGLNARMSEFNALLGVESLKMLEENVKKRNFMAGLYKDLLKDIPGISFQKIDPANCSSFKDFSILIDEDKFGLSRDKLCEALLVENIIVKKYFYPPLHQQNAFLRYYKHTDLKNTEKISYNSLSLPLYSHICKDVVIEICSALKNIYEFKSKFYKLRK